MLQIKLAKEIGFSLPFTCFSNRKNDIIKFASEFENVLLKSIENDSVWDENEGLEYVFYAKKVKSAELFNLPDEAFSQTVSFVQNYIEKKFELRITIVRDKIFASKIESQGLDEDNGKIDWRQGYEHGIKFEPFNLPEDISNKCLMYLRKMGLNFGCFDFIVTPADDYVFLECNPNGQWLWIELETGMKISQAIAEELMQKR
jgi:glutathione synthase/RimK-type ligase-like ATP-grasp enzyme